MLCCSARVGLGIVLLKQLLGGAQYRLERLSTSAKNNQVRGQRCCKATAWIHESRQEVAPPLVRRDADDSGVHTLIFCLETAACRKAETEPAVRCNFIHILKCTSQKKKTVSSTEPRFSDGRLRMFSGENCFLF